MSRKKPSTKFKFGKKLDEGALNFVTKNAQMIKGNLNAQLDQLGVRIGTALVAPIKVALDKDIDDLVNGRHVTNRSTSAIKNAAELVSDGKKIQKKV